MRQQIEPIVDFDSLPDFESGICYVYFLSAKDQVKIGKTKDLKRRFRELRNTYKKESLFNINGFRKDFKLHGYNKYHAEWAWRVESNSHLILSDMRVNGDWFNVDLDTAFRVVNRAAKGGIPYDMAVDLGLRGSM